jgi:hypothetical protein
MLEWQTIEREYWIGSDNRPYHVAAVESRINLSEFGSDCSVFMKIRFFIAPRKGRDCHTECYPYSMLINPGGAHIYLETVEEGKKKAEEIYQKLRKGLP